MKNQNNNEDSFSDFKLIEALNNGEVNAFNKLFLAFSKQLYYFSLGFLKSGEEAEEIVNEVFLKVWENRKNIKPGNSFESYIRVVARNMIYNQIRKNSHQQHYKNYIQNYIALGHNYTENEVDYSELKAIYKDLIEKLSPRQQEIFKLSREEGLSHKEIAERLNISVRLVKDQITKALKFIRNNVASKGFNTFVFMLSIVKK